MDVHTKRMGYKQGNNLDSLPFLVQLTPDTHLSQGKRGPKVRRQASTGIQYQNRLQAGWQEHNQTKT